MKVKDWIAELEKLNPEDELYVDNDGWGYHPFFPIAQKRDLACKEVYKRKFFHEDRGLKHETPIGTCSTIKLCYW